MVSESLQTARLASWRQDGKQRIPDPPAAREFIDRVGIATLYAVSSEFPSLLLGYLSDTKYEHIASWDSPGGHVYGWRWAIGKPQWAFYSSIVARKPTWVGWALLPAVLGALMERTPVEELYQNGGLSRDAYRVHQALAESKEPMRTGELRTAAGFPTGKEQRAAYLKAVEELESLLLLAKVFFPEENDEDMGHTLVASRYPDAVTQALELDRTAALAQVLRTYLPSAKFCSVKTFARHLRIPEPLLIEAAATLPFACIERNHIFVKD